VLDRGSTMIEQQITVMDVAEKVKLECETIYRDKELKLEDLTKILNIPLRDVKNILGVEK